MKSIIIITLFCLLQSLNLFAQNESEINQKWAVLKDQFKHKTELVIEFTSKLQKSKKIDKKELEQTTFYAKEFSKTCENKVLNKDIVGKVKQANDLLNTHLVRTLVNLEFDIKLKTEESILSLYDQLTAVENQILVAIKKYNEVCIKQNRKELIFEIHSEDRAASIKF
ncbi:LemA family protein [Flavobacterium sp. LC2016-12]|uniref:LemA family protein n=1 Tax=Flavobacterium sp. LC2016-12 TaxID=2783794 RepID=UPI00188C78A7|nr:LemA family protein [Flavobacterium sp. LC2016-12]MBF4467689.1 LemA family protein [Flavobacterium sp. LC2016-12]